MDAALAEEVLEELQTGRPLVAIARDKGFAASLLYRHLEKVPNGRDRLALARRIGAGAMIDQAVDIADSEPDPQRARVRVETRLKAAALFNPREFGAKLDLQVTERVDIGALHAAALARLRSGRDQAQTLLPQVIDGETVLMPHPTDCGSVASPAPAEFVPTCIDDLG